MEKTWEWISDGILHNERNIIGRPGNIYKLFGIAFQYWYCTITQSLNHVELQLSNEILQNLILLEIKKLMQLNRSSLKKFSSIPYPSSFIHMHTRNKLIYAELDYDIDKE